MRASYIRWLVVMTSCLCITSGDKFRIVGVVDTNDQHYENNLKVAVDYLNQDPGILAGHQVELKVIFTSDNDSYGAMDQVCQELQAGVDLIVDFSARYVTAIVRSMAEAMGITHVSAVDTSYEAPTKNLNVTFNIRPPATVLLQSIRDIVSQENLTNVGIIYDSSFDLDNKPKRLLRNIPAQHLYLRMATAESEIEAQLDKVKAAELQHLFLAATTRNAGEYLGKANTKGMMSFKYSWYVLTKDATLSCRLCRREGVVVLMTGRPEFDSMNKYIDIMNSGLQAPAASFQIGDIEVTAAFQFDLINLIGRALHSLVSTGQWKHIDYTECFNFSTTDPEAYNQAIKLTNKVLKDPVDGVFGRIERHSAEYGQQNVVLDIKRITFKEGTIAKEDEIGNWSLSGHLTASQGSITNKNIKKTYRVATIMEPPFVFREKTLPNLADKNLEYHYYNATTDTYYFGYCIDLIYKINESMKFEFFLHEPADGSYGTMQQDGSWNGLIRDLIDDRADIVVAPLSVMAERENVIDFTVPYYDLVGITILMKKPSFQYHVFKFMSVLEEAVWGCVFSAFIIVSILLAVFDKYSPYSYQNNRQLWDGKGEEPRVFTLKEGLWFCMTSLTPQGGGEAPRALSGRLVAATWWMFGFIMIATYTANLAAFLTVSRLDQPIESLDDLAKQFKTKYAPQASTATQTYFRRMADIEEKFYTIWKDMSLNDSLDQVERAKLAVWDYPVSDKFTNMLVAMKESGFPATFEEATDRILNPKVGEDFAYIGDATQNKYATLTNCDLWEVGEEFSRKPYALAVQEGSPLKNELSSVILQLLNQRTLEDLKSFWWEFKRKECEKIEDESDGISIKNIGGVFLVIFIGIGLGLITLAFEYYWYKWRPQHQSKNNPDPNAMAKAGHDNQAYDNKN